jgi:hypothetical protein
MLRKLLLATAMLFGAAGVSFAQRPWDPDMEQQRTDASNGYFAAQRDVVSAKEKEAAIDNALQKADINGWDYDRLARAAADASREREIAEDYRDAWERRAKDVGALVEASNRSNDNSRPVREATLRNSPRETGSDIQPALENAQESTGRDTGGAHDSSSDRSSGTQDAGRNSGRSDRDNDWAKGAQEVRDRMDSRNK